jgi:predicted transcriptional regulator
MATKVPPIPKQPKSPTIAVSVRLPADLVARLDAYAKKEAATRTRAMEHLLRWGLAYAELK